jgi:hypothetical protein
MAVVDVVDSFGNFPLVDSSWRDWSYYLNEYILGVGLGLMYYCMALWD